jgi:rhodanese-related sulfurtransferase
VARTRSNRDRTRAGRAAARDAAARSATARSDGARHAKSPNPEVRRRPWPLIGLGFAVALLVGVGGFVLLSGGPASDPAAAADDGRAADVVEGVGGRWSEVTVDDLDAMMAAKDFTLLNVKTPYIGEIDGTDLYIPYDQLAARASELPADKAATLVVYCRSGNQSAIAAQILVDLGYTNVVNVDGGMVAWADGGRQIVQRDRS